MANSEDEISACVAVLRRLKAAIHVDRVFLASKSAQADYIRIITFGSENEDEPDIVSLPSLSGAPCQTVLETNDMVNQPCIVHGAGEIGCFLMQAEMLTAFVGVPVRGSDGQPVACLSLASRLPRIWSRHEVDELWRGAEILRILASGGLSDHWHWVQHRDTPN